MLTRSDITTTLANYDVAAWPSDTDETLGAALTAVYKATPSDWQIDAHRLGYARRFAGRNAANMTLAMARAEQVEAGIELDKGESQ